MRVILTKSMNHWYGNFALWTQVLFIIKCKRSFFFWIEIVSPKIVLPSLTTPLNFCFIFHVITKLGICARNAQVCRLDTALLTWWFPWRISRRSCLRNRPSPRPAFSESPSDWCPLKRAIAKLIKVVVTCYHVKSPLKFLNRVLLE